MTSLSKRSLLLISLVVMAGVAFWNIGLPTATAECCPQQDVQGVIIVPIYEFSLTVGGQGSGTVNISPPGISTTKGITRDYDGGTTVSLTASAASGSTFAGWSGDCSGTGSCSVVMDSDRSVAATFNKDASVEGGCSLSVSKTNVGTGESLSLTIEASHPDGIYQLRYHNGREWVGRYECSDQQSCTGTWDITHDQPGTYNYTGGFYTPRGTWLFGWQSDWISCSENIAVTVTDTPDPNQQYTLTGTIVGTGLVNTNPPYTDHDASFSESYDSGTSVTLRAIDQHAIIPEGWKFAGWSGACSGTSYTCTVDMTQNRSVTATFVQDGPSVTYCGISPSETEIELGESFELTVGVEHPNKVNHIRYYHDNNWSNPQYCGDSQTCSKTWTVTPNKTGTLKYQAGYKPSVGDWVNCPVSVTVKVKEEIPGPAQHTLTLGVAGDGSGTVKLTPPGTETTTSISRKYDHGTTVTLKASAHTGSTFTGWSGACSGTSYTCAVDMTQNRSVTATFVKVTEPPIERKCVLSATPIEVNKGETFEVRAEIDDPDGVSFVFLRENGEYLEDVLRCLGDQHCGATWSITPSQAGSYTYRSGYYTGKGSQTGDWTWVTCPGQVTVKVKEEVPGSEQHTLSLGVAGDGSGTVKLTPPGTETTTSISRKYDHGATVTLKASAHTGSTFTGWSGACSGTSYTCTVNMTQNRSVTATFDAEDAPGEYILNVASKLDGQEVEGVAISRISGNVEAGTTNYSVVSQETINGVLRAPETSGEAFFSHWSGCQSSLERKCTVLVGEAMIDGLPVKTNSEVTVTAHYVTESDIEAVCKVTIEPGVVDKNETFLLTVEAQHPDGITYAFYHERGTKDGWRGRSYCHDQKNCTIAWPLTQSNSGTYEYAVGFYTPNGEWFECPQTAQVAIRGAFNVTVRSSIDGALQEGVDISRISGKWFTGGTTEYLISDWMPFKATLSAPKTYQGNEFDHWEGCTIVVGRWCTAQVGLWPYSSNKTITAHYTPIEPSCTLSAPRRVEVGKTFQLRMRIQHPEGVDYAHYRETGGIWSDTFDCGDGYECTAYWYLSRDQLGTYKFEGEFYSVTGEKFSCGQTIQVTVQERDPEVPGPEPQPDECEEGEICCVVIIGGDPGDHYIEECRNGQWVSTGQPCVLDKCPEGEVDCLNGSVWICSSGYWVKTDESCSP